MNRAREIREGLPRAKSLRLGESSRSGVFALHASQSAAVRPVAEDLNPAPERCESTRLPRRDTRQRLLKPLARNALRADGLAHDDLAAAQDCNRSRITDILAPDGRPAAILVIDTPLETCLKRVAARGARATTEREAALREIHALYRGEAQSSRLGGLVRMVDGSGSEDEVAARLLAAVRPLLGGAS